MGVAVGLLVATARRDPDQIHPLAFFPLVLWLTMIYARNAWSGLARVVVAASVLSDCSGDGGIALRSR